MKHKDQILLCESHKEIEPLLQPVLAESRTRLLTCSSTDAAFELTREHKPQLIILNTPAPGPLCHKLKMDSNLYYIPIFVVASPEERNIELQFLSNEFFKKPLQTIDLLGRMRRYMGQRREESLDAKPGKTQTRTKDRWIEKKTGVSYQFEYNGDFTGNTMESLITRVSELTAVGRKAFTINLLHADHIENIPISLFRKLQDIVLKNGGHLKVLSHLTPMTEELSVKGIDIDEYVDMNDFIRVAEEKAE